MWQGSLLLLCLTGCSWADFQHKLLKGPSTYFYVLLVLIWHYLQCHANCLSSQLLFSHVFLAVSWDYLLFTLGLCVTSWLQLAIHPSCLLACLVLIQHHLWLDSVYPNPQLSSWEMLYCFSHWLASFFCATDLISLFLIIYTFRDQRLPSVSFKCWRILISIAGRY